MVQHVPNRESACVLVVELHRHADHVVALVDEQRRGDGRIDAARHRDDHAAARDQPRPPPIARRRADHARDGVDRRDRSRRPWSPGRG